MNETHKVLNTGARLTIGMVFVSIFITHSNNWYWYLLVFVICLVIDNLLNNKTEMLKSKIKEKNLLLLDNSELDSKDELQKLYDWQEDYSDLVEWEEFKSWLYCDRCKGYNPDQCICYAR